MKTDGLPVAEAARSLRECRYLGATGPRPQAQAAEYRFVRNPTYLGLFLLNAGVWLIWPTLTVFILNLLFAYTLDIQVRLGTSLANWATLSLIASRTVRTCAMISSSEPAKVDGSG